MDIGGVWYGEDARGQKGPVIGVRRSITVAGEASWLRSLEGREE